MFSFIYTKLSTCGIIWFLDFAHLMVCQKQHEVTDTDIQFTNYYFRIPQTMDEVQKPDDPKRTILVSETFRATCMNISYKTSVENLIAQW